MKGKCGVTKCICFFLGWHSVVRIAALDCSMEEHVQICNSHIQNRGYPTIVVCTFAIIKFWTKLSISCKTQCSKLTQDYLFKYEQKGL